MNFIVELILELLFDGIIEIGTTHKLPLLRRIFFILFVVVIYGALIGVVAMIGMNAWQSGDLPSAIMLFVVDIAILLLAVYLIRKMYLKNSEKKESKE